MKAVYRKFWFCYGRNIPLASRHQNGQKCWKESVSILSSTTMCGMWPFVLSSAVGEIVLCWVDGNL